MSVKEQIIEQMEQDFPVGAIDTVLRPYTPYRWFWKCMYIILAMWTVWFLVNTVEIAVLESSFVGIVNIQTVGAAIGLLYALIQLHRSGEYIVFLGEKGLVVLKKPVTLKEQLIQYFRIEGDYVWIAYKQVYGIGENWTAIYGTTSNGSIYEIPVELQMLSHKDKTILFRRIKGDFTEL